MFYNEQNAMYLTEKYYKVIFIWRVTSDRQSEHKVSSVRRKCNFQNYKILIFFIRACFKIKLRKKKPSSNQWYFMPREDKNIFEKSLHGIPGHFNTVHISWTISINVLD